MKPATTKQLINALDRLLTHCVEANRDDEATTVARAALRQARSELPRHTPGPWELDASDWPMIINGPEDKPTYVASIPLPEGSTGDDEQGDVAHANAKLIAAAPDLALALLHLLNVWGEIDGTAGTPQARAAGEKATTVLHAAGLL